MIVDITKGFSHSTQPLAQNKPNTKGVRRKGRSKARRLAQNRPSSRCILCKPPTLLWMAYLLWIRCLRHDKQPPQEATRLRHNRRNTRLKASNTGFAPTNTGLTKTNTGFARSNTGLS